MNKNYDSLAEVVLHKYDTDFNRAKIVGYTK